MSQLIDEPSLTKFGGPNLGRLRRDVIFGAVLFTIAFALVQLYYPTWVEQPLGYFEGPPGYKVYADPLKGWTVAFPDSWHPAPYVQRRPGSRGVEASGITITNIEHAFPDTYPTPQIDPSLVAVAIRYAAGRHFAIYCRIDTELPLSFKSATLQKGTTTDEAGGHVRYWSKGFSKNGIPFYSVNVWIGSRASAADIVGAEAIVASINYRRSGSTFGEADCSKANPRF